MNTYQVTLQFAYHIPVTFNATSEEAVVEFIQNNLQEIVQQVEASGELALETIEIVDMKVAVLEEVGSEETHGEQK